MSHKHAANVKINNKTLQAIAMQQQSHDCHTTAGGTANQGFKNKLKLPAYHKHYGRKYKRFKLDVDQ